MSVKAIIRFLGINNTRLERKILMILDFENDEIEHDDDLLDSPLPSDLRSLSQMSLASQQKWNTSTSVRSNVSSGQRDNANRNPSCFLSFCRCGIRTRFF